MSRYVLTQEQLDRLQEKIQQFRRIHDAKQERIKELELRKVRTSESKTEDLLETIEKLEYEIRELKRANRQLAEMNSDKNNLAKIKELEMLLKEERKLREYSETFAKQVELKCAEETLIKDLTTELCQLQKAEIEIGSKRIEELQRKLRNSLPNDTGSIQGNRRKEMKEITNSRSKENFFRNKQLKVIIEELKSQLSDLYEEVGRKPLRTKEEEVRFKEAEKWLKEIGYVMADISDIESIRKDLQYLKTEIENKRKSSVEYQN